MKAYNKIALLVALALFLAVSACTRQASQGPVATPTLEAEAPFPYTTPGVVTNFGTQTAIAQTPVAAAPTNTPEPQVVVNTNTPEPTTGDGAVEQPPQPADTEAPPPPSQPIPEIIRPETYTLQRGEWPICIARRFDLELSSFFALNNLNMNSKPGAGTVLRIPSTGSWSSNYGSRSLRAHPTTYTVGAGENINAIACKFGDVSPEQILAASNLSSPADVQPGMTLNIP